MYLRYNYLFVNMESGMVKLKSVFIILSRYCCHGPVSLQNSMDEISMINIKILNFLITPFSSLHLCVIKSLEYIIMFFDVL
jgi:hypothetical protein